MKNKKSQASVIPKCNTKSDTYGGLWADEGVYRIAKETQLVKPDESGNLFLGLGGLCMEKILLACLGAYIDTITLIGIGNGSKIGKHPRYA